MTRVPRPTWTPTPTQPRTDARSACALLLAAGILACGVEPTEPQPIPPEAKLEVRAGNFEQSTGSLRLLEAGDSVSLVSAPQGGHVLHASARVTGLRTARAELRARLRDPDTHAIHAEEARTALFELVGDEQWEPRAGSVTDVAHIPVCPDYEARDVVGESWLLEVLVTELPHRTGTGSAEVLVTPSCVGADALALCECECLANYVLGKCGP